MSKGRLYLVPAFTGAVLRDPHTRRELPTLGGWVPDNSYWRRRIAAGDARQATPPDLKRAMATPKEQA